VQSFITNYFAWLLILAGSIFLVFAIGLLFTRYGNIRLGPDDSRPEYGTLAWFAMLYTAGMGIGLVYFAVAEPITHFTSPPTGSAGTEMAATRAINYAFFHWGLHPWATYIVLGLSLAYFAFRKGLPLKPSAPFYPLIGDRIYGPIGHTIDVLAVFGTMFGLATSLGIGAQQVGSGLNLVFGMPNNIGIQILLVAVITAVASVSVMLGLAKGIRRLSLLALYLSIALAIFVLIAGPTLLLLMALPVNIGYYAQNLVRTSFETFYLNSSGRSWQSQWTLFYWGWWISWSPFVGMFLARVSYGRTIRQFVAGVLFAPAGASFVWFTIFGDTTLNLLLRGNGGGLDSASESRALFVFFQQLPVAPIVATLTSVVAMVVIVLYFATSSDSGSLVIDIITNGGDPNPIWQQRLF
jgi:choline/glycine/proline betaine transport protein